MNYVLLGKRIRDERLMQRLTLEKLAERTDKSINFIGQIERGEGKPSLETLVDIANALGVTVDSLLYDNINANDNSISKEVLSLITSFDDRGKRFILDVVKRYKYFHDINNQ
ncbi:helix-turn-helix domain-containing protein [Oscillibacter sp. MSJ-2]|uniref:Helix-turn-helix domain-containing protein n=1 Tax=Dysosmobacter acutus TaxID=2841504 RepID=A0ABS6FCA8_9FIRM|nr:helix-turn-helix transcriptional regulator [Dysosmobacter acutus]MBU5626979.1 helix-turn-helix domain-containing protein [Dysosmobacter acutus]